MNQDDDLAYSSVEFSRTQGIFSATALGGSVLLGIAVFVAGAQLIQQSETHTPLVFLITPLLFLPLILSCIQRSSGTLSNTSFYAAARASGSPVRLFFIAWLMLAGYLTLGALLAYGAGIRANTALEHVLGLKVGQELVIVLIVAVAFVKEILTKGISWRGRTIVFWVCALLLIVLSVLVTVAHYRSGTRIPKSQPLQHWLIAVSMLASTLWIIDILLSYRGQFRHPIRTTFWSLICIFGGGCVLSALVSAEILRNPSLLMQNWVSVLSWHETRLELLILIAGFLICVSGLLRVMMRTSRLLGTMIIDGALPSSKEKKEYSTYYAILFAILLATSAIFLSVTYLLLISGFTALLSLLLYLQPLLKKDLSRVARISLPF
ncbi:MAG TPA: hypothetical protein VLH08_17765, partial [Acidobacteriota bacterium]|nr:hypothetical protein [Acidobacteriota bacterium]